MLLTGPLPGNCTHPDMSFEFETTTGILVVLGRRVSKRSGGWLKEDRASYLVTEVFDAPSSYGRVFDVENLRTHEVYRVTVGPNPLCTCRAGECNRDRCRHRDAVKAIIKTGAFPVRPVVYSDPDAIPF